MKKNSKIIMILEMSDFDLYDQINNKSVSDKVTCNDECLHSDVINEGGVHICTECGEEIIRSITHDKEWRFYGGADSRKSDPTRVHARKLEEKNISKDVSAMDFSDSVVTIANDLYMQCTNGQIYRGGSRRAVIFACVFHAYKILGNHQTPDNLIRTFGITRKAGLKGLKILNVNIPKDSKIHETKISPEHILNEIMDKFLSNNDQKYEVYEIHKRIQNRSSKLNRARPQSVAASVIYYWILKNKIEISLKDFAITTNLSEITINKNTKEVERVLDDA